MAGPGGPKTGGREKGTPNKISSDVKAMVLAALDSAGGEGYLVAQAHDNPRAFLSLLARIIPTQVTGADGKDLIPETCSYRGARPGVAAKGGAVGDGSAARDRC